MNAAAATTDVSIASIHHVEHQENEEGIIEKRRAAAEHAAPIAAAVEPTDVTTTLRVACCVVEIPLSPAPQTLRRPERRQLTEPDSRLAR